MSESLPLVRWDAPGPYEVVFSTRLGGVSEAPFDSLNLGRLTHDDSERVLENRRRLCGAAGADVSTLSFNRQVHGAEVREAEPQVNGEPADGIWTDTPERPLLVFTADCLPIALARANGSKPSVALLHAGWRGILAGIAETGAARMGSSAYHAVIGPGIGPCCYEVGEEVRTRFRDRFGPRVLRGTHLDLWTAAESALRSAGATHVARTELCTACHPQLFFSHRRDGPRTGRQGAVAYVA